MYWVRQNAVRNISPWEWSSFKTRILALALSADRLAYWCSWPLSLATFFKWVRLHLTLRRSGGTIFLWLGLIKLNSMISRCVSLIENRARKNHSHWISVEQNTSYKHQKSRSLTSGSRTYLRVILGKVEKLTQAKIASGTEVSPRVYVLKAKCLPYFML